MVTVASLVLLNADVRTMDEPARAEAIAIRDGIVLAVGDEATVSTFIGPGTEVHDLDGRVVLPGFVDAHVHLLEGGLELDQCALGDAVNAADVLHTLVGCGGGDDWLIGGGWDLSMYGPGGPLASDLDGLFSDRPVVLWSFDGHSAWVSSEVLRRARITAATSDPPAGRIERDPSGSPSGTLRESAMDLLDRVLPRVTASDLTLGLWRGVTHANRHGITTVLEANVDRAMLAAWRQADGLTVRATLALEVDDADPAEVRRLVHQRSSVKGPLLRADTAKIFVDGVIEARTAAMLEDYVDVPGAGELAYPPEQLDRMVRDLSNAGFGVHAHAIGDRAVRVTLDAMQSARDGGASTPFSIAHLEVIAPDDRPRFAALNVAAVFQTLWAYEDTYVHDLTLPGLTPSALPLYPVGSVLRAGGRIGLGSDWSVSSLDPLQAIEVAVTRRGPDGEEAPAMAPDEAIDVETALWAYTRGAAEAIGRGDDAGRIAAGRPADLAVLSRDPTAVPPEQIGDLRVVATLFGGRVVAGSL